MGVLKTGFKAIGNGTESVMRSMIPGMKTFGLYPNLVNTLGKKGKADRKATVKMLNKIVGTGKLVNKAIMTLDGGATGVAFNLLTGNMLGAAKNAYTMFTKNDDAWFRRLSEDPDNMPKYAMNHPIMYDGTILSDIFGGGDDFATINPVNCAVNVIDTKERYAYSGGLSASYWTDAATNLFRVVSRKLGRVPNYTPADFILALELQMEIYARYATLLAGVTFAQESFPNVKGVYEALTYDETDLDDANRETTIQYLRKVQNYIKNSIRLPNSLAQYIVWRYGNLYKVLKCDTTAFARYRYETSTVVQLKSDIAELDASAAYNQVMADLCEVFPNPNKTDWFPEINYDIKEVQMRDNITETRYADGSQRVVLAQGLKHAEAVRAALTATRVAASGSSTEAPFAVVGQRAFYQNAAGATVFVDVDYEIAVTDATTWNAMKTKFYSAAIMLSCGYNGAEYFIKNSTDSKMFPLTVSPGDHVYMTLSQVQNIHSEICNALLDV